MRQKRTIYFNDARHYYLFIFEPPMNLEDAWRPVDEVAGTGVDTFAFGVTRADGLFYPTQAGKLFCDHVEVLDEAIYWRVRENILSLQDRGHDLLRILIDRAHEKHMDFFASFRMGTYEGVDPPEPVPLKPGGSADPNNGGRGLAEPEARENQLRVLKEIATGYPVQGLELDFASHPGGSPAYLLPEDVEAGAALVTEHVRRISEMVRGRPGTPGLVGARVPNVESMCRAQGLDIRTWLGEGLVDYVVPMMYLNLQVDTQMNIDWLVEAAHQAEASVYGMLQPFVDVGPPGAKYMEHFSPDVMRAAASNFLERGADGVYTWFLNWPLGPTERSMLTEMGDPDLLKEGTKRYLLPRRNEEAVAWGYDAVLPIEVERADPDCRYSIPLCIADDVEAAPERIGCLRLGIRIRNTVSADCYTLHLNGESLAGEPWSRGFSEYVRIPISPHRLEYYSAQWLRIELRKVRPHRGENLVELSLDSRPPKLGGGVIIEDVELEIAYSPYPSGS